MSAGYLHQVHAVCMLQHAACAAAFLALHASTDRAAVAQLNYQLICQDANIHRSIAQRIITEILQRLAMHIVAGNPIKVRDMVLAGLRSRPAVYQHGSSSRLSGSVHPAFKPQLQ